ncbi:MAG: tautomerase family protein [Desulfurivibrio sp.]
MPYVNIRVAGNLSREQKERICTGVTDLLVEVANKPADSVLVFIDEVPHENIAAGGRLLQAPKLR